MVKYSAPGIYVYAELSYMRRETTTAVILSKTGEVYSDGCQSEAVHDRV